jgi:hypothetical protein
MPEPAQLRGYPLLRLGVEGNGKLKQKCQRGSEFRCAPAVPAFVGRLVRPAPAVADVAGEPPRNGRLLPVTCDEQAPFLKPWKKGGRFRNALPICLERRPRALCPALHPATDQNGRIHRPGGRAGDRLDLESDLLEKPVEHAPSERAKRAAALQGKINEDGVSVPLVPTLGNFRHACPFKQMSGA